MRYYTQVIISKWFQVGGGRHGAVIVHRFSIIPLLHCVLCEPQVLLHHLLKKDKPSVLRHIPHKCPYCKRNNVIKQIHRLTKRQEKFSVT